jgi:hypothetical protein
MRLTTDEADEVADEFGKAREFAQDFMRSRRGNRWRRWNGLTLTIFEQPKGSGWFGWCIADEHGPRFSERLWDNTDEATDDLWNQLPRRRTCWQKP